MTAFCVKCGVHVDIVCRRCGHLGSEHEVGTDECMHERAADGTGGCTCPHFIEADSTECPRCHFDTVERRCSQENARLSDEELTDLTRLDGPPPVASVLLSRSVQRLALRAVNEIRAMRGDKLVTTAKFFHQVREQLRRNALRSGWGPAMARDALLAELKQAEDELLEAADAFGKGAVNE